MAASATSQSINSVYGIFLKKSSRNKRFYELGYLNLFFV
ncbi:hypothetical protein EV200_105224 [Pedobacter psychrotolerans]|uniref:Uncharacterized protein n=1 Tax=Pedobacter psychrotolerans TaxID=1843235 RepID=A0A4R2HAH6_9SPHI|nr:hypothetical protein EV200_105224 [Pedobacter psychrotolerans]